MEHDNAVILFENELRKSLYELEPDEAGFLRAVMDLDACIAVCKRAREWIIDAFDNDGARKLIGVAGWNNIDVAEGLMLALSLLNMSQSPGVHGAAQQLANVFGRETAIRLRDRHIGACN